MKPQIGDIWYNHLGGYHYLILKDDAQMGMFGEKCYTMMILEKGMLDHAFVEHFNAQCKFVC